MGTFEFLITVVAWGLIVYFTVLFVFNIRKKGVTWGGFKQWPKNIIDSLFGLD